ncbi:MAG: hypothetical protein LBT89_09295 [Planctomycetaceae bacterium]|jgi:hypothetical protein|nr:hypothetical protein [Planctomycetaceae bacterium]
MKETPFGYGPWEYRYACKACGHTVKPPKNKTPCSRCGGDFGPRISMRKLYLEAEKPPEMVDVPYLAEPTFWESLMKLLGFSTEPKTLVRKEKRPAPRRWRWQTHAEVEDETGIIRHDNFLDDETFSG